MARGDKSKYSEKQKRQAEHIEEGYRARGISEKEAERRSWATVNLTYGGGKKSGSGKGAAPPFLPPLRDGARFTSAARSAAARSASARKAARTRKRHLATAST